MNPGKIGLFRMLFGRETLDELPEERPKSNPDHAPPDGDRTLTLSARLPPELLPAPARVEIRSAPYRPTLFLL